MTAAESLALRLKNVKKVFQLTDDAFVDAVLASFRNGYDGVTDAVRERLTVEDFTTNQRKWYKIKTKKHITPSRIRKILYLHGGAYVMSGGDAQMAYIEFLANNTGAEVWYPDYPIAPEQTCQESLAMLVALYEMMLQETPAQEIAIMGDSAGGGLVISLALHCNAIGLPQPADLVSFSPVPKFTFETRTEEEAAHLEKLQERDILLSLEAWPTIERLWKGTMDADDYRLNTLNGQLHALAPMVVFSGTGEILNLPIRQFVEEAQRQNAKITYFEKELMPHGWTHFNGYDNESENAYVIALLNGALASK